MKHTSTTRKMSFVNGDGTNHEQWQYEVTVYTEPNAECIIVQPVDSHDMEEMANEIEYIERNSARRFCLAAVKIKKWNDELTPWEAPPVFGKIPFGNGAAQTLDFICRHLVPSLQQECKCNDVYLGGYSLAGLFALWASCQTAMLRGVVAASPSVWYKDWLEYSRQNPSLAHKIYLSLGDRESHSKNKLMATVADAINKQKDILDAQQKDCTLEWNQGNHFTDNGERTAKGFVWLMRQ